MSHFICFISDKDKAHISCLFDNLASRYRMFYPFSDPIFRPVARGCRGAPPPNLPKDQPLTTTKWAKNEVFVGGLSGVRFKKSTFGVQNPAPPPKKKSILATGLPIFSPKKQTHFGTPKVWLAAKKIPFCKRRRWHRMSKNYPFEHFLGMRVRSQSCGEWPLGAMYRKGWFVITANEKVVE